ncbi:MAG: NAD-dependent epimerase/dehydratase family protein [Hyphomicrobium sp.]
MRVLVIGATGFIGRRLVEILIGTGHSAYAVSRHSTAALPCEHQTGSVVEAIAAAIKDWQIDAVVNLAAAGVHPDERDSRLLTETNVILPPLLVRLAATSGAGVFIHLGSSAEYSRSTGDKPISEDSPLERRLLYGASKAAGSLLAQASGHAHGIPVAVLRPFNIFGPGERPYRLLPTLISKLQRNERVPLSPGKQVRDFLFIDDACVAIIRLLDILMRDPSAAREYNLGSGVGITVAAFSRAVAHAISADPELLDFGALDMRPDDLPYVVASTSRLDAVIGPAPIYSLEEALDICSRTMKQEASDTGKFSLYS